MKKFSFMNKIKLNKNKTTRKMFLLKQFTLLLATAFILIFAVFAWFAGEDKSAEASGIRVTMEGSNNLLISLNGGKDFFGGIDLMAAEYQQYISPENLIKGYLEMKDITSDGKTFYRPVFKDENSSTNRLPDPTKNWEFAGANSYISEKVVFRTTEPSSIYLGESTAIITSAEKENKLLSNTEPVGIGNKSSFGNFSNDCIVGALRISVINSNNELEYVYIPRKDIEMTKTIDGTVTRYNVITDFNHVSASTALHKYFKALETADDDGNLYEETISESTTYLLGESNSTPIATTTLQANGFYEASATINIWLEGSDPEVTRALSGGKYFISLDFAAVSELTD